IGPSTGLPRASSPEMIRDRAELIHEIRPPLKNPQRSGNSACRCLSRVPRNDLLTFSHLQHPPHAAAPMITPLNRRAFLGGLAAAVAAGPHLLGQDKPAAPPPQPIEGGPFEPDTLFLTWQRDPTTTMTIQWVVKDSDDPVIRYANRGKGEWVTGP